MHEGGEPDVRLMAGETRIWEGTAAWPAAARPPRRGTALARALAAALLATFAAAAVIGADPTPANSPVRALFAALLVGLVGAVAVLWGRVAQRALALFARLPPRPPERYLLTDRRLVLASGAPPDAEIVTVPREARLVRAMRRPNGGTQDLELWFAAREDDDEALDDEAPVVLHALEDAREAEHAILCQFARAD